MYQKAEKQKNFEPVSRALKVGVSIQNFRKVFPTTPETVAVKDLSMNLYQGQIFALLGHNVEFFYCVRILFCLVVLCVCFA